jgi:hypothetical protein
MPGGHLKRVLCHILNHYKICGTFNPFGHIEFDYGDQSVWNLVWMHFFMGYYQRLSFILITQREYGHAVQWTLAKTKGSESENWNFMLQTVVGIFV